MKEDGKTVVLVLLEKKLDNKKTYKLQVSNVKTLSGLMVEKVVKEFKVDDNQVPTVESVVVTGPKNLQLTFSEPIMRNMTTKKFDGATAKVALVNSKSFSTGTLSEDADLRKVNVTTFALKDGSTYKVLVQGFQDFAKYKNIDAEIEFEYAKVTNAPTVEVVSATQEYVEVKFDRPVKGLTKEHFYHTYSAWKPQLLFKSVEEMNRFLAGDATIKQIAEKDSVDKAVVRFIGKVENFKPESTNTHPLQVGEVEFNILGKAKGVKIQDSWGNQLEDTELKVTVTADKTAPVVENVEVTGEKEITVTFSKKVIADKDNYELLKEDGGKLTTTVIKKDIEVDGNSLKLKLSNDKLVGKTAILNIKNVKDATINMNKLVGTESFTITFGDKKFEGAKEASYLKDSDLAKIRISFDEAVDSDKATNTKNYKLYKGKTIDVDFEASMLNEKIVELIFTKEQWKKISGSDTIAFVENLEVIISNAVTDLAGNTISGFQDKLLVKQNSTAPKVKSVVAEDISTIKITFSEAVSVENGFVADNFKLINLDGYAISDVSHDENVVTITLDGGKTLLPYNVFKKNVDLEYTGTGEANKIKNILGEALTFGTQDIKDKISPKVMNLVKASETYATDDLYGAGKPFALAEEVYNAKLKTKLEQNDEIPGIMVVQDGGVYTLRILYTEPIEKETLSNGTYTLTSNNAAYTWKIEKRPEPKTSGEYAYVEAVLKAPSADDLKDPDIFTGFELTQNTSIKDEKENSYKMEDTVVLFEDIQFAGKPENVAVETINAQITAKKAELIKKVKTDANLAPEKTPVALDDDKEDFSTEYSTAMETKIGEVKDDKVKLEDALAELKKLNDLEKDIKATADQFVPAEGIAVKFAKHASDALKTTITGVGSDKYRIQVLDADGKKYLVGAKAADVAASTVVELADGDFTFGTDLTGATAESYVLVTKVDAEGKVLAQMQYQVKAIAHE